MSIKSVYIIVEKGHFHFAEKYCWGGGGRGKAIVFTETALSVKMFCLDISFGFTLCVYQTLKKHFKHYNDIYSFNPSIFLVNIGKEALVGIFQ